MDKIIFLDGDNSLTYDDLAEYHSDFINSILEIENKEILLIDNTFGRNMNFYLTYIRPYKGKIIYNHKGSYPKYNPGKFYTKGGFLTDEHMKRKIKKECTCYYYLKKE